MECQIHHTGPNPNWKIKATRQEGSKYQLHIHRCANGLRWNLVRADGMILWYTMTRLVWGDRVIIIKPSLERHWRNHSWNNITPHTWFGALELHFRRCHFISGNSLWLDWICKGRRRGIRDRGAESLGIYCNLEVVGVPDNARSINKKATFNG